MGGAEVVKKAVVLLSGGLDSATTLYIARNRGYRCYCLIFDYNQRHRKEVDCAKKIAKRLGGTSSKVVTLSFPWGGSALLDKRSKLPSRRPLKEITKSIPPTYVPMRNTIFLSFAAGWAEALGAEAIFIGANAVDFSGYPDCRPGYFDVFNRLLKKGSKRGAEGQRIKVFTPLVNKKKSDIIKIGASLRVPWDLTWSCYEGGRRPCGKCDSCRLRKKGFGDAGITDPLQ